MSDGTEPIDFEEILYRRISTKYYDPEFDDRPSPVAYRPTDDDDTGLSLTRAKHSTIEDAARGFSKKGYYVAVLKASDLFDKEVSIVPRPLPDSLGHCELPQLTVESRSSDKAKELQLQLAELSTDIRGPFRS